jgi:CRP/FNR family transcriptional regulator, dissimilatory nitrate respiration regulator
MSIEASLKRIFLFESLTAEEAALLASASSEMRVRKGAQVFSQGTEAAAFYIVAAGKVKIHTSSSDGREQVLHVHGAGELVAEAAIFDSMEYPASCIALEDSLLIKIPRDPFVSLISQSKGLCLRMMGSYSKRLRQFVTKLEEMSLKDVRARLAAYLLGHSTIEHGARVCRLEFSKKDLSALLGTTPETLSRALAFMKERGMIREIGGLIMITDAEKLKSGA